MTTIAYKGGVIAKSTIKALSHYLGALWDDAIALAKKAK